MRAFKRFWPLTWLVLFSLSCALLSSPPQLQVPTPPPAAPQTIPEADLPPRVTDPESSAFVPGVDPEIVDLMGAVSAQNLFAYVDTLTSFGTRHAFSESARDDVGVGAARRWIFNEFQTVGNGRLEVSFDDFPFTFNGLSSNQRNVVAVLPGQSDYAGILLLTAHYDSRTFNPGDSSSRAPGANDNGSGVALLLEAARLLSSRSWNQTIMFVAFAAEELGTPGSRHFVQSQVILANQQIDGVLNFDIVGGRPGIPASVRVFAQGPADSLHQQWARYVHYLSRIYLPTFEVTVLDALDREGRYSDHREFVNVGVPALRLTESIEDFSVQHTGNDTSDRLDYNYLTQVVQLAIVVAANVAGAPAPAPTPLLAPMANPGAYILTWIPDQSVATYAISFRPVDSPEYATFRYVRGLEAGNVAYTDLDPNTTYAVSMSTVDINGRVSRFTPEVLIGPGAP